ncbi:MAG: hypothetical protein FWD06_07135 [Oscillospiraceae bacterium]|nr:hypothetical protein [Oscillospiraceae bacterium]
MKHAKRLLILLLVTLLAFGISTPAMANTPAGTPVFSIQPADATIEHRVVGTTVSLHAWATIPEGGTVNFQWQRVDGTEPVNIGWSPIGRTTITYDGTWTSQQVRVIAYNAEDSHLPLMQRRHAVSNTATITATGRTIEETVNIARILAIIVTVAGAAIVVIAGVVAFWWFIGLVSMANTI